MSSAVPRTKLPGLPKGAGYATSVRTSEQLVHVWILRPGGWSGVCPVPGVKIPETRPKRTLPGHHRVCKGCIKEVELLLRIEQNMCLHKRKRLRAIERRDNFRRWTCRDCGKRGIYPQLPVNVDKKTHPLRLHNVAEQ